MDIKIESLTDEQRKSLKNQIEDFEAKSQFIGYMYLPLSGKWWGISKDTVISTWSGSTERSLIGQYGGGHAYVDSGWVIQRQKPAQHRHENHRSSAVSIGR